VGCEYNKSHEWQTWTESIQLLSITGLQMMLGTSEWIRERVSTHNRKQPLLCDHRRSPSLIIMVPGVTGQLSGRTNSSLAHAYAVSFLVVSEIDSCKEEAAGGYTILRSDWHYSSLSVTLSASLPPQLCSSVISASDPWDVWDQLRILCFQEKNKSLNYDFLKPYEFHISKIWKGISEIGSGPKKHKTKYK